MTSSVGSGKIKSLNMRNLKQQKMDICNFTEELALLEKRYKVYVDGFYVTGACRDVIDTNQRWELDDDEHNRNDD